MPKAARRLAIVGADSLLGRELRERLSEGRLGEGLILLSEGLPAEPSAEGDAEPVDLKPASAADLAQASIALLAGTVAGARVTAAYPVSTTLIDLTGGLAGTPGVVLRAPAVEPERYLPPESRLVSAAHPAAVLLALFLRRLSGAGTLARSVVTVFEPASQHGQAAIDELQQQTAQLLNFRPLPKAVYDEQVTFNLMARWGTEAPRKLAASERRIREELAALLALDHAAPAPSLRLVQAPVFHAYCASVWVEFAEEVAVEALQSALQGPTVDYRDDDVEPLTNVSVAGQSGFGIDRVEPDTANPRAFWFWLAADNLRLAADNAILVAASILEQASRGVQ